MPVSRQHIENFVRETQEAYNENSVLRTISNWEQFNSIEYSDLEFIQVGRITGIPENIFSEDRAGVGYQTLAQDLTKPIWRGELMSISDEIIDVTEEHDRVSTINDLTHESLVSGYRESNANHIFLPITDSYWDLAHQWHDENKAEYTDEGMCIQADRSEMKVHWLPTDRGYESVYLMDSDQLSVVQKRYEDTDTPGQIEERAYTELNENSRGQYLMNYFAESDGEEIDLLQRVVFWKSLDPEGAFRIDPQSHID